MLQSRMELNPGRFSFYHPTLALVDRTPSAWVCSRRRKFYNALRDRFGLNPNRFTRNHPPPRQTTGPRRRSVGRTASAMYRQQPPRDAPQVSPRDLGPPTDTTVTTPTTPTDPTTPTNPTDPTNPTNPGTITPADPTDFTNPAEPRCGTRCRHSTGHRLDLLGCLRHSQTQEDRLFTGSPCVKHKHNQTQICYTFGTLASPTLTDDGSWPDALPLLRATCRTRASERRPQNVKQEIDNEPARRKPFRSRRRPYRSSNREIFTALCSRGHENTGPSP